MNVKFAQAASLIVAILTTGLTAGLFFSFAVAVMPALAASSDRTYVEAMRKINIVIINPLFLSCFLGALFFGLLALVIASAQGRAAGTAVDHRGSGPLRRRARGHRRREHPAQQRAGEAGPGR